MKEVRKLYGLRLNSLTVLWLKFMTENYWWFQPRESWILHHKISIIIYNSNRIFAFNPFLSHLHHDPFAHKNRQSSNHQQLKSRIIAIIFILPVFIIYHYFMSYSQNVKAWKMKIFREGMNFSSAGAFFKFFCFPFLS